MDLKKGLLGAVAVGLLLAGCGKESGGKLQVLDGFAEAVTSQHNGVYPDYRASVESYWAYKADPTPQVAWRTATVAERNPTTFVFTGSMGQTSGKADLYVNGTKALTFDLGVDFQNRSWSGGGVNLQFAQKVLNAGNSGVFYLNVPKSMTKAASPVELRVDVTEGEGSTWFMVKGYRDTVDFEKVTVDNVPKPPAAS